MEAARVDICYRPLRIAFAIHSEDKNSFRAAVRTCHALRGGRYNPIVLVDRPNAVQIAKAFRVDVIVPMGSRPEVQGFHKENFPHLVTPTYSREIFSDLKTDPRCHLLDMHNTLLHWHGKDHWKMITDTGVRKFGWSADDPLADVFLMQLGAFPDMKDCGFDYADLLQKVAIPHPVLHLTIDKSQPLSPDIINHPSIGFLNVWGINPHYSSRRGWEYPGFYVGDAGNIDDLVNLWNLRAADQFVTFLDMAHLARYEHVRPMYEEKFRVELAGQGDHHSKIGVWCRVEITDQAMNLFRGGGASDCQCAYLGGHDDESTSMLPGACRLDGRVQRQQVRLKGNLLNHADDVGNLRRRVLDAVHGTDDLGHDGPAALGGRGCGLRQLVREHRVLSVLPHVVGQVAQCSGGLRQGGRLLFGTRRQIHIAFGNL